MFQEVQKLRSWRNPPFNCRFVVKRMLKEKETIILNLRNAQYCNAYCVSSEFLYYWLGFHCFSLRERLLLDNSSAEASERDF